MASSATPAVATSTITLGASNSGRMTMSSVRKPNSIPASRAPTTARPYGTPFECSRYSVQMAAPPNSPWAKLNTPLDL